MKVRIALIILLVTSFSSLAEELRPHTIKEAVDILVKKLESEDKEKIVFTSKDDLIKYHHGWGTGIRNQGCPA